VVGRTTRLSGACARAGVLACCGVGRSTPSYRVRREPAARAHGGTWPDRSGGVVQRYLRARGVQVSLVASLSRVPRSFRGRRGGPVSESLGFLGFRSGVG
jgi:hypothetical protein